MLNPDLVDDIADTMLDSDKLKKVLISLINGDLSANKLYVLLFDLSMSAEDDLKRKIEDDKRLCGAV